MASIFKRKYNKVVDGRKVKKQSKCWYVKYRDADGIERRVKGYLDKEATKQMAARLEKETALASEGVVDRYKDHRLRPLREHSEDFRRWLLAKGNTEKHAELTYSRAMAVIDGCKFILWGDISASRVVEYLAELRNNGEGISAQTSNFYLQCFKQFCKWMVQDQRAAESPVTHLNGLNVKVDRRHDRRALGVDEFRRLLAATTKAPKRFCMTGPERAMLYRLTVETGLRANELRTLTVSSFDLAGCTVKVLAGYSKHRREDTLPLRKETAAELQVFFSGKLPTVRAFHLPSKSRIANMVKADLAGTVETDAQGNVIREAKPYVDDAGRYADFHGLRHTCGTWLGACGVPAATIKEIMRHGDLRTTSRYVHTLRGQEVKAVESLPDLSLPSSEERRIRATGTDGGGVEPVGVLASQLTPESTPKSTPTAFSELQRPSLTCIGSSAGVRMQQCDNSLPMKTLGTEETRLAQKDIAGGDRRRWESNPRITVLQTVALGHLATPPSYAFNSCTVYTPSVDGSRKFVEVLRLYPQPAAFRGSHAGQGGVKMDIQRRGRYKG
jgi:integrase